MIFDISDGSPLILHTFGFYLGLKTSVEMCNMVLFFTVWVKDKFLDIENIVSQSGFRNLLAKIFRGLNS